MLNRADASNPFAVGGLLTSYHFLSDLAQPFSFRFGCAQEEERQLPSPAVNRHQPRRYLASVLDAALCHTHAHVTSGPVADGDEPTANFVLYQSMYKFASGDPEDLSFEANEILQITDEGRSRCLQQGLGGITRGVDPQGMAQKGRGSTDRVKMVAWATCRVGDWRLET